MLTPDTVRREDPLQLDHCYAFHYIGVNWSKRANGLKCKSIGIGSYSGVEAFKIVTKANKSN